MKRYWEIYVYDGTEVVFQYRVPVHRFSDAQIENCIQHLAAKYLTEEEIVLASVSKHKGGPQKTGLLDVRASTSEKLRKTILTCGENPHVVAHVVNG